MRPQEVAKYSLEKDSKKSFDGSIYVFFLWTCRNKNS